MVIVQNRKIHYKTFQRTFFQNKTKQKNTLKL